MPPSQQLEKPSPWTIRQIQKIAQYQFGPEFVGIFAPEGIQVTFSKNTNRLREIWFEGERLATKRPKDGLLSIALSAGERIIKLVPKPKRRVIIQSDVAEFIKAGRNVFAKHVVAVDPTIRPEEEVVVVSEEDELLAIGRAKISAENMLAFSRGIAVKVRYGIDKKEK
jgi:predicted RNA-binding protein (TIGR00451 family)